ncbi:MAG: hypothetical protein ACREGJ_03085 [Candidatus Saccharimonadales bacterium]
MYHSKPDTSPGALTLGDAVRTFNRLIKEREYAAQVLGTGIDPALLETWPLSQTENYLECLLLSRATVHAQIAKLSLPSARQQIVDNARTLRNLQHKVLELWQLFCSRATEDRELQFLSAREQLVALTAQCGFHPMATLGTLQRMHSARCVVCRTKQ